MRLRVCRSAHKVPEKKKVYSKRKDFAPMGSTFLPLRVNPFSDGRLKSRSLFRREAKQFRKSCLPLKCIRSL